MSFNMLFSIILQFLFCNVPSFPMFKMTFELRDFFREFVFQTIRHLCPCVRCSLAVPAVLVSGEPGVHFPQTLYFSRFIACPRAPLEFKAFWAQYRALAAVWRTCVTSFFIDWIGPWRSRIQKSALL